jgi:hypothetical protein
MTIALRPTEKPETPQTLKPKEIAAGIVADLNLPTDLRGRLVNLVRFSDEESCRLYYPDRSLGEHEVVCAFVRAEVRRRGGETCRTVVSLVGAQYDHEERATLTRTFNYLVPVGGLVR